MTENVEKSRYFNISNVPDNLSVMSKTGVLFMGRKVTGHSAP